MGLGEGACPPWGGCAGVFLIASRALSAGCWPQPSGGEAGIDLVFTWGFVTDWSREGHPGL